MAIIDSLKSKFKETITHSDQNHDHSSIIVEKNKAFEVLKFLKENNECAFNLLLDICGVDYLGQTPRFEVVYHLYSLTKKERVRVRVKLDEKDLSIPSVFGLWQAADWFEREAFDMFGIHFEGHPKLERLLLWDGFEGHPLRKDYPIDKRQQIPVPRDIV